VAILWSARHRVARMIRLAACVVTSIKFGSMASWGAIIPFVAFALDRWMIWEGNKYEKIEEIPVFSKITMLLPSISIWTMLLIALVKTS